MLIGGLGMGFTLAGVLKDLGPASEVVVAELVPAVVTGIAVRSEHSPGIRSTIRACQMPQARCRPVVIRAEERGYDAILLDVDNGPAGLTSKTNDGLYSQPACAPHSPRCVRAASSAIWSAGPDAAFTKRLQQAGFDVEQVRVRGRGKAGGSRFLIWIARRR